MAFEFGADVVCPLPGKTIGCFRHSKIFVDPRRELVLLTDSPWRYLSILGERLERVRCIKHKMRTTIAKRRMPFL